MAIVHPSIFEIIQRFPQEKKNIIGLHSKNQTFRAICSDLNKCRDAHQYWSQLESTEAQLREKEYRELMENLWVEIDRFIKANCTNQQYK